ncbi:MAG: hypothetical protein BWY74_03813 [Firmicutes bacterium ADurb.Bin419]|nr:MAG: hypothetical protein BWY74_03813 [Firmicutes bacterium ADurb.Bin419]
MFVSEENGVNVIAPPSPGMNSASASITVTNVVVDLLSAVAVIVVVPDATAVTTPPEDTVATLTSLDAHTTVLLVAFSGKTVAVIVPVSPSLNINVTGLTLMELTLTLAVGLGVEPPPLLPPPLEEPPLAADVAVGVGVTTATVVGADVGSGPICTLTSFAATTLTGSTSNFTPSIFTSATSTVPLPFTSIAASVTKEVIVAPSFTSTTVPVDALSIVTFTIVPPETSTLTFTFISILSIFPANTFISASFEPSLASNFAILPFVTSIFDSDNISTLLKSPSNCTIASDLSSFFTSTSSNPTSVKSFSSSLPPDRSCIFPTFVFPLASSLTLPSFF